ncbi:hypothetical protein ACHAXS_010757 [Conticribra weissflogii]
MLPPSSPLAVFLLAAIAMVKTSAARILPTPVSAVAVHSSFVPLSLPTRRPTPIFFSFEGYRRFHHREPPYSSTLMFHRDRIGTSAFLRENIANGSRHFRRSASPGSSLSSSRSTEESTQRQQHGELTNVSRAPELLIHRQPQPTIETNRPTRRRHEIFQRTNAISKYMPVPHPDLWKHSALGLNNISPVVDNDCNENENAFSKHDISGREKKISSSFWKDVANNFDIFGKDRRHDAHGQRQEAKIVEDVSVKFHDPEEGARLLLQQYGILTPADNGDDETKHPKMQPPELAMQRRETLEHLTNVLSYFQEIASAYHHSNINNVATTSTSTPTSTSTRQQLRSECQARIVSTIGPIGTKCPRWHADHVPVRLVMSIIGPGCEFVPHEMEVLLLPQNKDKTQPRQERRDDGRGSVTVCDGSGKRAVGPVDGIAARVVDRGALNHLEEEDTRIANDLILLPERVDLATLKLRQLLSNGRLIDENGDVRDDVALDRTANRRYSNVIQRAREGEAVLLMGRGWEDKREHDDGYDEDVVLAAVHRSPRLEMGQHRVLLTVDLVDWDYE